MGSFRSCEYLRHINLPAGLKKIEAWCFSKCNIEEVTFPASVVEICDYAFYQCWHLRSATFSRDSEIRVIGDYAFAQSAIESFVAPASLREVGGAAFHQCL